MIRNLAVGIFAILGVSLLWYVCYPAIWGIIKQSENATVNFGVNTSASTSLFSLLYFLNAVWGVAVDIALIGFLLISVHQREWESKYQ